MQEGDRHGGEGWKMYNTLFHQTLTADKSMSWVKLNPAIYATTFLAMQDMQGGSQCTICMELDHKEADCALATE